MLVQLRKLFLPLLLFIAQSAQSQATLNKPDSRSQIVDPNAAALLEYSPRSLALGGISFSNPAWFNAYDINGATLGLLQRETRDFRMILGHNYNSQKGDTLNRSLSNNNFFLPAFFFNQPGTMGSSLYYRKITDDLETDSLNQELSLHNLGFNIAVGLRNKFFQASLSGHGIYGNATDDIGNERLLVNVQKLEVGFGSQPHPLIQLGGKFGASGSLDTLASAVDSSSTPFPGDPHGYVRERRGTLDFPNFGFFVDFGDTTLHPLLINIGLNWTKERIWGQHKYYYFRNFGSGPATLRDSLRGDSIEFKYNPRWTKGFELNWNSMYNIKKDDFTYRPAVIFGIWRRTTQRRIQGGGNTDPFGSLGRCTDGEACNSDSIWFADQRVLFSDYWDEFVALERHSKDGIYHEWNYWGLDLGVGFSQVFSKYGVGYMEVEYNGVNFTRVFDGKSTFRGYNRVLIGAEWNVHSLPNWKAPPWFLLFARAGFVTATQNSNFRTYRPYQYQFFNRYSMGESDLYHREYFVPGLGEKLDWTTFNLGLGTSMWEGKLEVDFNVSFFSQKSQVVADNFFGSEFTTQIRSNF